MAPSNNTFNLGGWTSTTAGSSVTGGGGSDTIVVSRDANFTLTNAQLTIGTQNVALSGIGTASLTGGSGNNTFTVTGWTGGGSLAGGGGGSDSVVASKGAGFTLSDSSLTATDNLSVGLSGITSATLTSTGSTDRDVDARNYTGTTSLTASGSGKVRMIGGSGTDALTIGGTVYGYMLGRAGNARSTPAAAVALS